MITPCEYFLTVNKHVLDDLVNLGTEVDVRCIKGQSKVCYRCVNLFAEILMFLKI